MTGFKLRMQTPRVLMPGRSASDEAMDLVIEPGRRTVLMGRSGAGKTLLARLALGQLPRSPVRVEGQVELYRADDRCMINLADYPFGSTVPDLAALRGLELSFVPQGGRENLVPGWSVRDHFDALLPAGAGAGGAGLEAALASMEALGVEPSADNLSAVATGLSEGMIRRILVALAMAQGAQVLVVDEPTTGLDPASRDAFRELLETRMLGSGAGVLLITHDVELAIQLGGETLLVDHGTVVARTEDLAQGEGAFAPFIAAMQTGEGVLW